MSNTNLQIQNSGMMPEFPIMGPAMGMGIYTRFPGVTAPIRRSPSDIPLNIGPDSYGSFCDPEIRMISPDCIEQFPYLSNSGQYQYNTGYAPPLETAYNNNIQNRRPYPFYEWGCMGLYQVQYPDTQYPDTKSPLGIDKVYGPSFGEWVTGPWLVAITQEVYHQYNPPLGTPWG
jgi:hypothetical protein